MRVIYFDVESRLIENGDRVEHEPYLVIGVFCNRKRKSEIWHVSTELAEWWKWVTSKVYDGCKLYLFAHNVTYDFVASMGFEYLNQAGYEISNFYEKGRTFILEFQKYGKETRPGKREILQTITILNVGNFYSGSVAQLGKTFGLPKLEMDYEKPTIEQAIPYCKRDVEIIKLAMEAWFSFLEKEDLGGFANTVPGQAFIAYRHRFMPEGIYIHDNLEALDLERAAYYGGRVECWRIGEFTGEFYGLDINSMYPFVMREFNYPVALERVRDTVDLQYLEDKINTGKLLIAEVEVDTMMPCFPLRIEGQIIFPIGTFRTVLSTPEIQHGLQNGYIKKVYRVAVYRGANIFQTYVDYFYTRRLDAKARQDPVHSELYKLLLNSLYGKFGQKAGGWELVGDTDRPGAGADHIVNIDDGREYYERWINGKLFRDLPETEGFNSFPAVAAHVTAYARMHLYRLMEQAGFDNLYYCDTDSLFVNREGLERLTNMLDETKLGYLKKEKEGNKLTIYAPKDYVFAGKIKHKGVSLNPEMAKKTGPNTWRVLCWPHIGTLIKENSVNHYYNIWRVKELKRRYYKGYLYPDSKVYPLFFERNKLQKDGVAVNMQDLIEKYGLIDELILENHYRKALQKENNIAKKEFRRLIIQLGGINDPDYELLPRWCKRKKGHTLDYLISELREAGYWLEDANELYDLLWRW